MLKAFLSHTAKDKDIVRLVHNKLSSQNAWFDAIDIENGESIPEKINEGLRIATHYVLFWSEAASKSPWVNAELNAAFVQMMASKCKFMIFTLDNTDLPELLQPYKYESVNKSDIETAAQTISEKIMSQEGAISKLSEYIDRTKEIGDIEESVRDGYKLIILHGILGIGKSSLAEKSIQWIYPNRAMFRIILDFSIIPGIAELSIELSRQTKTPLKYDNSNVTNQRKNIQFFLEFISASNIILILKDVKRWLDEDGSLIFSFSFIFQTKAMFYYKLKPMFKFNFDCYLF